MITDVHKNMVFIGINTANLSNIKWFPEYFDSISKTNLRYFPEGNGIQVCHFYNFWLTLSQNIIENMFL